MQLKFFATEEYYSLKIGSVPIFAIAVAVVITIHSIEIIAIATHNRNRVGPT